MKNRNLFFYLFLAIGFFLSCSEEVDYLDLGLTKKNMVMGYVGSVGPASVKIFQTVPINTAVDNFDVVSNAQVVLLEESPDKMETQYVMNFKASMESYLTQETEIMKIGYAYSVKIKVGDKIWTSKPITINQPEPNVEIDYLISGENTESNLSTVSLEKVVTVIDSEKHSYIIDIFSKKDQLINFFRAISNYEFFDKVTRNDLKLIYSVFISAPNLEFIMNEHDTTVMQLPHEVSSFFRDWAVSEEGNYDDNISQLFSIPADNLKSNFLDQNGNAAEGVVGVFFPCHLFQN